MSLNEWFIEYIYIPLGGNKKGKFRRYINILIVFVISGLWHGAEGHFVIGGMLNGILSILEKIFYPIKTKILEFLHIDKDLECIIFFERMITFILITIIWVFFNNSIPVSITILRNILTFNPTGMFCPEVLTLGGDYTKTFIIFLMTTFFCFIQFYRKEEEKYFMKFRRQPAFFRCLLLAILLYISIFTASSAGTDLNTSYLYFQ